MSLENSSQNIDDISDPHITPAYNESNMNNKYVSLTMNKRICDSQMIICQMEDVGINFIGELGAIGRISTSNKSIGFDLKGYSFLFRLAFNY